MRSVDLIYQYLKEYSKETVEQFDDLMDQAEQGNVFAEEDRYCQELCANWFADSGWMRSAGNRGVF